ncbi:hypothetical protein [Epilithonimonas hispanica]|uniref:hypothetical protein n=1 Tax=Epilithonimonas hispanica TaxID=358687 RepID=UPI001FECE4A9|nr:hypothetical protein [Epilithonimonas hispanica]
MKRNKKKFWLIFPCVIGAMGLFIWFFQWLWNTLLPEILGVKAINYWQAFGILLLSKILFGGFNGKKFGKRNHFEGSDDMRNTWKQKFESRFCGTEQEREELKAMWKQKLESKFCGTEEDKEKFKEMWKQKFESKFCKPEPEIKENLTSPKID